MLKQPLVSVIIPTFNRADRLKETLYSIKAQTYKHWECLVIDDGSDDHTKEAVNGFVLKDTRFQYHNRPSTIVKGGNGARNYGFDLSQGEYIQWFDDDDIMLEDYLEERLRLFTPETEFIIGSGYMFYESGQEKIPIDLKLNTNLFKDYVLWRLKIMTPSVLFRKQFLKDKVLFNTSLARGQEAEFFSRLFFTSKIEDYAIINKPLFLYRQHEQSKTQKNQQYVPEFKSSETFIAVENLKRSIQLHDIELTQFFYKLLINFFFRSVENKHDENANYILKQLRKLLFNKAPWTIFQLIVLGNVFLLINRGSYKIEMYFKQRKVS